MPVRLICCSHVLVEHRCDLRSRCRLHVFYALLVLLLPRSVVHRTLHLHGFPVYTHTHTLYTTSHLPPPTLRLIYAHRTLPHLWLPTVTCLRCSFPHLPTCVLPLTFTLPARTPLRSRYTTDVTHYAPRCLLIYRPARSAPFTGYSSI